jgi:hypothetical protein
MATFGNVLTRQGGTAMSGKTVTITLAIPDKQKGAPIPQDVAVLLLPVSETRKAKAFREAEAYVDAINQAAQKEQIPSTAPSLQDERTLRYLCESMRDPEDARKFFVGGNEIDKFRDCLISEQVNFLTNAYNEMIKSEYAELRAPDTDAMRQKAAETFQ